MSVIGTAAPHISGMVGRDSLWTSTPTMLCALFHFIKKRVRIKDTGNPARATRIAKVSQSRETISGRGLVVYKKHRSRLERKIISVWNFPRGVLETVSHPFLPNASPEMRKTMLD